MNKKLAAAEPAGTEAKVVWTDYLDKWTTWNHVRTAAALLGTAAFSFAL